MINLNASLNPLYAATEAARNSVADRAAQEALNLQLQQAAAQAKLAAGTTITARYQYKVNDNGALVATQTEITTTAPEDALSEEANRGQRQQQNALAERRPTFVDLLKPKPELSPSDEVALFGTTEDHASAQMELPLQSNLAQLTNQTPIAAAFRQATAEALDEDGNAVEAQLITPDGQPVLVRDESLIGNLAARAQFAVAGLYSRNSDLVYHVTPLRQFAA